MTAGRRRSFGDMHIGNENLRLWRFKQQIPTVADNFLTVEDGRQWYDPGGEWRFMRRFLTASDSFLGVENGRVGFRRKNFIVRYGPGFGTSKLRGAKRGEKGVLLMKAAHIREVACV